MTTPTSNTNTNGGETTVSTRDLLKRAPNTALLIAGTVVIVALIGGVVALALGGKSTQPLGDLVQEIGTILAAIGGAGGLVYGSAAARSAEAARIQTNGSLDARMKDAVAAGIATALDGMEPHPAPPVTIGTGTTLASTSSGVTQFPINAAPASPAPTAAADLLPPHTD